MHIGRPVNETGAHCEKHNSFSIGVCYIGGLSANGKPKDTRTPKIYGHYHFANKSCPCFKVSEEIEI